MVKAIAPRDGKCDLDEDLSLEELARQHAQPLPPSQSKQQLEAVEAHLAAQHIDHEVMRDVMREEGMLGFLQLAVGDAIGATVPAMDAIEIIPCDFFCRCNREKYVQLLGTLPDDELVSMAEEEEEVKLRCHMCNEAHCVTHEEIRQLISRD